MMRWYGLIAGHCAHDGTALQPVPRAPPYKGSTSETIPSILRYEQQENHRPVAVQVAIHSSKEHAAAL
jgi:hypothetical protein